MSELAIIFAVVFLAVIAAGMAMKAGEDFGPLEYAHDGFGG